MCQGHPWGQSEPDCQALTRQRKTQASGETEKKNVCLSIHFPYLRLPVKVYKSSINNFPSPTPKIILYTMPHLILRTLLFGLPIDFPAQ